MKCDAGNKITAAEETTEIEWMPGIEWEYLG